MPARPSPLLALALLVGCDGDLTDNSTLLSPISSGVGVAVEVSPVVGTGNLRIPVRLVNSYQAAIPGSEATVSISGVASGSPTVDLSATGVAELAVTVTGPGAVDVTVTGSADNAETGATARSWSLDTELPGIMMSPTVPLPDVGDTAQLAASGTGGLAFAAGQRIWWQPATPGTPAAPVARMGFEVAGLESAHIDSDGVRDLVVWAGNEVVLLRGLGDAGFMWAGGWRAKEGDIVGVRATDLDADRLVDLAIGVDRSSSGVVHVLFGDGQWNFEGAEPLELTHEIRALTASDEGRDGYPDISAMSSASGTIRRHTLSDDGWIGASTFELTGYEAADGARLLPQTDINDGGDEEIIIQGAPDSSAQDFVFYVISETPTHYPLNFGAYFAGLWDLDLDGAVDMLAVEDDQIHVIRWDGEGFVTEGWTGTGAGGPVAAGPYTDDALPAIGVVSDAVTFHRGAPNDDDGAWSRDRFGWRAYNTALSGPLVISDVSGDGVGDIVGFTSDPDVVVAAWQLGLGDAGQWQVLLGGKVDVAGGEPTGLVRCGADYFALAGAESDATLTRIRLEQNGSTWRPAVLGSVATTGSLLACGDIDTGESGVVVADTSGFWTTYTTALVARGTGTVGATGGVALGDTDGDALGEVFGCGEVGCSVTAADLDGDGLDEVATATAAGTTISWASEDAGTLFPGTGTLSTADIDGDGALDVLAHDAATGRTLVYRTVGSSTAWPAGWQTERELLGPVFFSDMTGDGVPELVVADVDGRVMHTGDTDPAGSGW
jgi:hypothetical protein